MVLLLRTTVLPTTGALVRKTLEAGAQAAMTRLTHGEAEMRRQTTSTGVRPALRRSVGSTIRPHLPRQPSRRRRAIRSPRRRRQLQLQLQQPQPQPLLRLLLPRSPASQRTSASPHK